MSKSVVLMHTCHNFNFIVTTSFATYYYCCLYAFMTHAIYLFTRGVVDSLYLATPKSKRVVLMHS